eukprot:168639-Hanusia_phi.AAC.4
MPDPSHGQHTRLQAPEAPPVTSAFISSVGSSQQEEGGRRSEGGGGEGRRSRRTGMRCETGMEVCGEMFAAETSRTQTYKLFKFSGRGAGGAGGASEAREPPMINFITTMMINLAGAGNSGTIGEVLNDILPSLVYAARAPGTVIQCDSTTVRYGVVRYYRTPGTTGYDRTVPGESALRDSR